MCGKMQLREELGDNSMRAPGFFDLEERFAKLDELGDPLKELSGSAKSMLADAGGCKFLALEESAPGTRIWSHQVRDGAILQEVNLWRLSDFLDQMT